MKNKATKPLAAVIAAIFLVICAIQIFVHRTDDLTVSLAVRVYVLSLPPRSCNQNELIPLVSGNPLFLQDGEAVRFLRKAGNALAQGKLAYKGPPVKYISGMPPELPGKVDAMMRNNGVAMGQEFLWLAQVLPSASVGDWGPYNTTGTQLRQDAINLCQNIRLQNPAVFQAMLMGQQMGQADVELAVRNFVHQLGI